MVSRGRHLERDAGQHGTDALHRRPACGGGPCRLSAALCDGGGRTLRSGSLDYAAPDRPVWLGSDLGKTDEVPAPWTPLSVDGGTVGCWGREYVFGDSALPTQVVTQGEPLLRDAVRLTVSVEGRQTSLGAVPDAVFAGNEAEVRGSWSSPLGPLVCRGSGSIQFDGFFRVDLELRPEQDTKIDELELVVPLSAEATLYHHANGTWTKLSDAGGIGDGPWRKTLPFVPYVWIGSERGGLAWFCESNDGWRNSAEERAVEIVRTEEGVDLRVHFFDVRTTLSETVLSYFALDYTQTGTPEHVQMEREWRRNPYSESGLSYGNYGAMCNASTWADFLVWAIDKTMDATGTDGVYLDCCNPNFCRSIEHGCAAGRYPLFATRELMKRIYTLVRRKRGPAGFVYAHNSENNLITTFSFTDAVLNGEQYNRKDLGSLTLEKFRAELSPQPYGVPAVLLPTLVKFQPQGKEKMAGAEFLRFPLLHDVICIRLGWVRSRGTSCGKYSERCRSSAWRTRSFCRTGTTPPSLASRRLRCA